MGAAVAADLRGRGHRVHTVEHRDVPVLTSTEAGYLVDPESAEQIQMLVDTHLDRHGDLTGVVDCWPLDMSGQWSDQLGAFPVLRLIKALAAREAVTPRLFVVTANAQPAGGTPVTGVGQAAMWGLGRVLGHQEFAEYWGGLIDIDSEAATRGSQADIAALICGQLHDTADEDQIALRGGSVLVPRLRPCSGLTRPFPTKLTADATYVVTGGAGALGRVVATYLAEHGARHITLLSRTPMPPRSAWPELTAADPQFATVEMIRGIERLGADVRTVSVDIADGEQVRAWLDRHDREGGRPVRGVIHAAGTVADQLLINMSEADFAKVMAPKVTGTRVLHEAFLDHDLEFFVMFGSAGSTIASPGQGNYAAANAYLDAFAHYRRSLGLPALTIGWGPWSVGMVEELNLEKLYAARGIELITPAVGAKILDRVISQDIADVVAITADWARARQAGLGSRIPAMFSELGATESAVATGDTGASLIDLLAATPDGDRAAVIAEHVRGVVAAVFDCAPTDIEPDDMLDDIGLDSMMAMEFRVRINTMFSIDLPVLEILRGVSVNSLAHRIHTELQSIHHAAAVTVEPAAEPSQYQDADLEQLLGQLSESELRALLAELESPAAEPDPGGAHP